MSQDELRTAIRVARKIYREGSRPVDETLVVLCALVRAVELLAERQDNPSEADSGIVAKLEQKIKMQHAEMGEARARVAELEREQRKCIELITEAKLVMPGRTLTWAVGDLIELHATAKKKVDELEKDKRRAEARVRAWGAQTGETEPSAPRIVGAKPEFITVDGKTPGEVLILAQHDCRPSQVSREMLESAERDAIAVLRAFGQPSQTTTGAVEALRRVRHAMFPNPRGQTTDPEARHRMQIIDDEIAKLKAKPAPASDHAHELGSCSFCDKQPANPSPVQYANEVARYGTEVCARAGLVRNDSGSPPDTSTESGLPDAQTPGQVGLAAWNAKFVEQHGGDIVAWENESMEAREREEASARAVLDVYGKRMVREALRKGLHRIQGMGAQPSEETFKADVIAALNEEIAELASVPSRPDVVLREMS